MRFQASPSTTRSTGAMMRSISWAAFLFGLFMFICGLWRLVRQEQERKRRIKRSLDALYADQPTKLPPAEWKRIVEDADES